MTDVIRTSNSSNDPRPSDERNGCFLDKMWCCKVCDGEIPDGHTDNCDIWKLEKKHRDFLANEYNAVLIERDFARRELDRACQETREALSREVAALRDSPETLPSLSEEAKICIGRSLAELAVLHKDGKTYNIRRVAGQALEVINNLHLTFARRAQKALEPRDSCKVCGFDIRDHGPTELQRCNASSEPV